MTLHRKRRAAAFTLIEMLVVIVITGLTATLVMQGIGQGLGLYRRVSSDQGTLYRELMSRDWLRQTLGAAVATPGEGEDFAANSRQIRLLTFRPLLGSEGVPTPVEWTLLNDGSLEYREGEQLMRLDAGTAILGFAFQDDAAAWHERWPPDDRRRLPERIRLLGDTEHLDVAVATRRTAEARPDLPVPDRD